MFKPPSSDDILPAAAAAIDAAANPRTDSINSIFNQSKNFSQLVEDFNFNKKEQLDASNESSTVQLTRNTKVKKETPTNNSSNIQTTSSNPKKTICKISLFIIYINKIKI